MKQQAEILRLQLRRPLFALAALLIFSGTIPVLVNLDYASAATISTRSLSISTGQASASATYALTFTPAGTSQIESMKFQACTTALGTCTPGGAGTPTGINLSGGTLSQGGFQGATAFVKDTTTAGCTTVDTLCMKRTDVTAQTITAHVLTDTGAINQNAANCSAAANCTFFIRITTYSDTAYATPIDNGTVASSTTQVLTVNAFIQEQLSFCVGATAVDDATSTVPLCSSVTGTSVSLGTLNSSDIAITPVTAAFNGDANNGLAELGTNATNGATVVYDAIQQSGTNHLGTLRVAGAVCNAGAVNTDQCINAIGTTKATLTAGTEDFGMTIAGVNCSQATATYTCSFSAGTYNLIRDPQYNCNGVNTYPTTDKNEITGTSACSYTWDEVGTADTIASSAGSTNKVVANEALILKFAATPNLVTPTGSYTAKADFVATPTY